MADYEAQIHCPNHHDELLTNFCCIKKCLTALCPECIDEHNKRHRQENVFPEIDTVKRVRGMCVKQVTNAMTVIEEELGRVKKFSSMSADDILGEAERELSAARKTMHKCVDEFFDSILDDYAERIRKDISKTYDFKELEDELKTLMLELRDLDDKLRSRDMLNAMRKTCSLDMSEVILTYQEKVQRHVDRRLKLPIDVDFSEKHKRDFLNDLGKYVRILEKEIGISMPENERNRLQNYVLKIANDETTSYFSKKFKNTSPY